MSQKLARIAISKYRYLEGQGWDNSLNLCKPLTASWVCITVSNFLSPASGLDEAINSYTEGVFCC